MFENRELKKRGRQAFKNNYGRAVAVCFIVVFLTAAFTTSSRIITHYNRDVKVSENVIEVMGVQSAAYATGGFVRDLYNQKPSTAQDLKKYVRLQNLADATLDPNGATVNAIKVADHIVVDGVDVALVFMCVGFILKILYNIFISSVLYIGSVRFFLENRKFKKTAIHKLFSMFWLRNIINPSLVMLSRWIYQGLWWLTIGGGIYKRYEYFMIPYILAENPNIKRKTAFEISKKMMMGNKFKVFKLELSFFGWEILNVFTLGLLNILFTNGYKGCTYAELYMEIRNNAFEEKQAYSVYFIDSFLEPDEDFVIKNEYVYPYNEYMVSPKNLGPLRPERKYSINTYILFFFLFSFVGWCFEVGMHLVGDGVFVNRGTMHGPWLPIFGFGGIFVILCMRKFIDKPIFTFLTIAGVCTVMEYIVSVYLEAKMGVRWWDYSEYFMNFQGRVCLYGALVFGFGGCGFLYFIAPVLDNGLQRVPKWAKLVVALALIVIFVTDIYISLQSPNMGAGITDYELAN